MAHPLPDSHSRPIDTNESLVLDDRICPGCKLSAITENGGLVVAFGQSLFHVDCFKCAKCSDKVTADTNLLLLSDGSPICANCSYSCNVCGLPILDEAIMTGDDSYHAHCFKCKVCKNRIDELVFAKTTQGIYCMNCHNERMIKIRRYTQKKAEREKEKALANSGSLKLREQDLRQPAANQESIAPNPTDRSAPGRFHASQSEQRSDASPPDSHSHNTLLASQVKPISSSSNPPLSVSRTPSNSQPNTHASRVRADSLAPDRLNPKNNDAPNPPHVTTAEPECSDNQIHDDGVKTSNPLLAQSKIYTNPPRLEGLTVLTSRRDKRGSITPVLALQHMSSLESNANTVERLPVLPTAPTVDDSTPSPTHPRPHSIADSLHSLNSNRATSPTSSSRDVYPLKRTPARDGGRPSRPSSPNVTRLASHSESSHQSSSSRMSQGSSHSDRHRLGAPSHHVDVPETVGFDLDAYLQEDFAYAVDGPDQPPLLPPKDDPKIIQETLNKVHGDSGSEEILESPPVERTPHYTFIAPALPPIRFSLNAGDFSQLFNGANGPLDLRPMEDAARRADRDSSPSPNNTLPRTNGYINGDALLGTQKDLLTLTPRLSTMPLGPSSTHRPAPASSIGPAIQKGTENQKEPLNNESMETRTPTTSITVTEPNAAAATLQFHPPDLVQQRFKEVLQDARDREANQLKLDRVFAEAILDAMENRGEETNNLKAHLDGFKRTSRQYMDGLTVAQTEYDKELRARREAETEITRLRVLLSGQAAKLTALSGDARRRAARQEFSEELHNSLSGLQEDLSKLKVERDIALAELEELSASKGAKELPALTLSRSLATRLDTVRSQYQHDLVSLTEKRDDLRREITDLKAVRDIFLEETTALNARNEELAQLSAVYSRRVDTFSEGIPKPQAIDVPRGSIDEPKNLATPSTGIVIQRHFNSPTTLTATSTYSDENGELRSKGSKVEMDSGHKVVAIIKRSAAKIVKDISALQTERPKPHAAHSFQQLSILRITRCDHCGDKMWGSQIRCTVCSLSVHVRCINSVTTPCSHGNNILTPAPKDEQLALPPSMFGRLLTEQVGADAREGEDRWVPIIVEKCIEAVEAMALDYEGIYRKTGGSGQSRTITQLFERGDYASFDLKDSDRFNDICSVTSVLKTYFRSLPVPLLTFDLHEEFMQAVQIKDAGLKHNELVALIDQLPKEHYCTLRMLMIHLSHIREQSDRNLMNARNLGVVFGPTLMRSRDPTAEFADMAGKALSVEWMVENAENIFFQ